MSGSPLSVLKSDVFASNELIHLQELSLTNCDIHQLNRFSLRNLTNLVKLSLSENQLKYIPGYAFGSIHELRYIFNYNFQGFI